MYKGTAVVKKMLQEMTLVWDQYDSWMFLQEVFYTHKGCIYLIKNMNLWNIITI